MKRCSKCGVVKDISEFYCDRSRKDGFRGQCKACDAKYLEEHRVKIAKQKRKYRDTHKEEISKYNRIYSGEHRDERAKYLEYHRGELAKYGRVYYRGHREERAKYGQTYLQTDKGKALSRRKHNKRRALKKNLEATLTTAQWTYILKKQNNCCNVCGKKFTAKRPATQDHIIPMKHNGDYSSDNIQALCRSCNSSKNAKLDCGFIQTWSHGQ